MFRVFFALLIVGLLAACVSSGEDYAVAAAVGKYLDATGVVPADTREADRTHKGKIVYFGPGRNGSPHFTYYEITDPDDMQKLKRAAEIALKEVPTARKITLHFLEKQVFHQLANGSGSRGREREVETIVVERER
jgi:hypothetical protein